MIFSAGGILFEMTLTACPFEQNFNTDFFCIPYMWSRYDHTNIFPSREKKFVGLNMNPCNFSRDAGITNSFISHLAGAF